MRGHKLRPVSHEAGGPCLRVTALYHAASTMRHGAHVDSKDPPLRCFHYVNINASRQPELFRIVSYHFIYKINS